MIEILGNVLQYLGVSSQFFVVDAADDSLVLAYDAGSSATVTIADGTYTGDSLAAAMQAAINLALTCSSTVSWNSTTSTFSFVVPTGHTLTFTQAGSSMSLLVGFTQSHTASATLLSDVATGDPTSIVSTILSGVDAWLKRWLRNNVESTSYKEWYDGDGSEYLFPKQTPIISIERLAVGRLETIQIQNLLKHTYASVTANNNPTSVMSPATKPGLVLSLDGVADSSITFDVYTTLGQVTDAINLLGNGWEALLQASDYSDFLSTEIQPIFGMNTIWGQTVYLYIPDYTGPNTNYEVYPEEGYIFCEGGWTPGRRNILLQYTAGYAAGYIPDDIQLAELELCKWVYKTQVEETVGVTSYSLGDVRVSIEEGIKTGSLPGFVLSKAFPFRKILV